MNSDISRLKIKTYIRFILFLTIFLLFIFLPAGSVKFLDVWLYCIIFFASTLFITIYFLNTDPYLIERRTKMKEKEQEQKLFQTISGIIFFVDSRL